MESLHIRDEDKILILAPHPDDECIGCGGLLRNYPTQCSVWVLTDGCIGQGDRNEEENRTLRRTEFEAEMKYLGIKDYRFFCIKDGMLSFYQDVLMDEDLSIFSCVFVTGDNDAHADHTATYICLSKAYKKQGLHVPVYTYEVHKPIDEPSHYLDITDVIAEKKKMIRFHVSQLTIQKYDDMVESLAEFRGHQFRMSGRCLEVYKEVSFVGQNAETSETYKNLQKFQIFYRILTRWMLNRINGFYIVNSLKKMGIKTVSIYGYAEIGKLLYAELSASDSGVRVVDVMDKKGEQMKDDNVLPVYPSAELEKPDMVIVTAPIYYKGIKAELLGMGFVNIVSIETVLGK